MNAAVPRPALPPALVLLVGVLAVSSGSLFVRAAEAAPLVKAAWRLALATAVLLPFALWKCRAEWRQLRRRDLALGTLAGFFLAVHFATWIASLNYTSVANSTVLVNTTPVWVALLARWLTGEQMSRRAWLGLGVSVAGGAVIGLGDFAGGARARVGDALALAGSVALACYILCGRHLRARLSLPAYLTLCYGSATVLLWAAVWVAGLPARGFTWQTWGALLGMALISQHLGHSSYNWAMKYFSAGFVAVGLLAEPVLGSLLAWWLLGEALTAVKAGGGALILAGIYLAATPGREREG